MDQRQTHLRDEDKEVLKEAFKEVLHEWLDEKYAQFGKWSLHGFMAMALGGIVWLILVANGWHK